jgi:hypothetical protein
MAIPTGTYIEWRGTAQTIEANGASIANSAVGAADDLEYDTVTHGEGSPDVEMVLSCAFGTAPTEGAQVTVAARPLDVISTNDTEASEATRLTMVVGAFTLNNVTTTQYIFSRAYGLPKKASYSLLNGGGQTMSAGWVLTFVPIAMTPKV